MGEGAPCPANVPMGAVPSASPSRTEATLVTLFGVSPTPGGSVRLGAVLGSGRPPPSAAAGAAVGPAMAVVRGV